MQLHYDDVRIINRGQREIIPESVLTYKDLSIFNKTIPTNPPGITNNIISIPPTSDGSILKGEFTGTGTGSGEANNTTNQFRLRIDNELDFYMQKVWPIESTIGTTTANTTTLPSGAPTGARIYTLANHGLTVGDVVRFNNTNYYVRWVGGTNQFCFSTIANGPAGTAANPTAGNITITRLVRTIGVISATSTTIPSGFPSGTPRVYQLAQAAFDLLEIGDRVVINGTTYFVRHKGGTRQVCFSTSMTNTTWFNVSSPLHSITVEPAFDNINANYIFSAWNTENIPVAISLRYSAYKGNSTTNMFKTGRHRETGQFPATVTDRDNFAIISTGTQITDNAIGGSAADAITRADVTNGTTIILELTKHYTASGENFPIRYEVVIQFTENVRTCLIQFRKLS